MGEEDGGSQWRGPVGRLLTNMSTSDNEGPGPSASAAAVRPMGTAAVAFSGVMETTQLSTNKAVAAASTDGE